MGVVTKKLGEIALKLSQRTLRVVRSALKKLINDAVWIIFLSYERYIKERTHNICMMNLRHCDRLMKQVAKEFKDDRVVGGVFECVDCGKKFKVLESW